MMKTLFGFLLSLLVLMPLEAQKIALGDLPDYADGLNIEGGLVAQRFLGSQQIWANICLVLDRPFHNSVDWDELTDSNVYPLKEASIPEFNEKHTVWVHASALRYYVQQSHALTKDAGKELADLVVQVHRNTSGERYLEVLRWIVENCMEDLGEHVQVSGEEPAYLFPDHHCRLTFRYGYDLTSLQQSDKVDVVLSLSLVAGLNPNWESGTSMLPETFLPFDLHSMVLAHSLSYASKNHLLEIRDEIVATQSLAVLEVINHKFFSANPEKEGELARPLSQRDFRSARILQANGMFCPKQLPEHLDLL